MGNSDSKNVDDRRRGIGLTPSEESLVCQMFGAKNSKSLGALSQSRISDIWSHLLTEQLLELYLRFVFDGETAVGLNRFIVPYASLVSNVNANPCTALIRIVGDGSDSGAVGLDRFSEYLKQMFASYVKILGHFSNRNLNSWTNSGVISPTDDADKLAHFLIGDMEVHDDKVTVESIERWLYRSPCFKGLSDCVLGAIYNVRIPRNSDAMFPEAVYPAGFRSNLNLAQVFAIGTMLPKEATSRWRLLFSIDVHGESWSTMLKCIMRQGPTVIVIWDDTGASFGAYAASSWNCCPQFYGDETCFLFALGPNFVKFEPTGFNRNFQYLNTGQTSIPNGLGIGGQFDYWGLFIDSEFGAGKVSPSCSTFRDYKPFAQPKFKIVQMEIWATGKADPTPEELGERSSSKGGVFGSDPAAEALLEMVGKTIHSRGLRPDKDDEEDTETS